MWQRTRPYLIVLSAALNLSFVGMWIAHAAPARSAGGPDSPAALREGVWCPLHSELGVTQEQWQQIEPRLREFQASAGVLGEQIDRLRMEVIDLLAGPEPDLEAVRAKQEEILATKRVMQGKVAVHLLAEKQILTPEQQQRLFQTLRDRAAWAGAGPSMSGRRAGRGMGQVLRGDAGPQPSGDAR
ncbi:MAG: periplasmic heavy metal sensor [Candidatus Anammoximicrobium sp.]|nr:periplasmic heavy metal sensor [Candidatus Anammoximicrobium sp.]